MRVKVGLVVLLLAIGVLLAIGLGGCAQPAKDFNLIPLDDQARSVSLADFKGKTVLLDFWATWCGPCNKAMPEVQSVWNKYHSQGLEVVSISRENRDLLVAFHNAEPYTYPVYVDPEGKASDDYQVQQIPRFILIKDGKIVWDSEDAGYTAGEITQHVASAIG